MRKSLPIIFIFFIYSVASFTVQDLIDTRASQCGSQFTNCVSNSVCDIVATCLGSCDPAQLSCRNSCFNPAKQQNNEIFWELHLCVLQNLVKCVPDENKCLKHKCKNLKHKCLNQDQCSIAIKCEDHCSIDSYECKAKCVAPYGSNIPLYNYLKCKEECIWKDLV